MLFDDDRMLAGEIRAALLNLAPDAVVPLIDRYRKTPGPDLTWELVMLEFLRHFKDRFTGLDSGWAIWEEFASSARSRCIPGFFFAELRRNYFARMPAESEIAPHRLRTLQGRSIGDFLLLADRPAEALRCYEEEIRRIEDNWELRLKVGNCHFRVGDEKASRSTYRIAWLAGMPPEAFDRMLDRELVIFLLGAEDREWAFAEACVTGVIPSPRYASTEEFRRARSRASVDFGKPEEREEWAPRQFCAFWEISENRHLTSESDWTTARRMMKRLNPRLMAQYLANLEGRPDSSSH